MKLIVGLGNPGLKYEKTRHNIGFDILELLGRKVKISSIKEKFNGIIGEVTFNGEKIILLKPQTFMNLSGDSVGAIVKFYKIEKKDILIVYDDMDLPLGQIRFKEKGSSGGHNGIKSIITYIGQEFSRVKCGIGKPVLKNGNIDFVTSKFSKEEQIIVNEMMIEATKCIEDFIAGIENSEIMKKYN